MTSPVVVSVNAYVATLTLTFGPTPPIASSHGWVSAPTGPVLSGDLYLAVLDQAGQLMPGSALTAVATLSIPTAADVVAIPVPVGILASLGYRVRSKLAPGAAPVVVDLLVTVGP